MSKKDRREKSTKPGDRRPPHKKGGGHKGGGSGGSLPEISVLNIIGINEDGELIGQPAKWDANKQPPHIVVTESGRSRAAAKGDRVLAKLRHISPHLYHALVIRVLPNDVPVAVLGVFRATADGGVIEPISRKLKESFMVARGDMNGAQNGELVSGVSQPGMPSLGMSFARITERLGRLDAPRAASLIASHMHNLPSLFSREAIDESESASVPAMEEGRTDLRDIPLVTIDGEDARDFDDAVFAEKDGDGFHLLVAIADVAYYVKEGTALDDEAVDRGNSVYFPDRVIPMLPERLSNGLCSLMPNDERYCIAVHIWIDSKGAMKRYKFVRGLMKSEARLTYTEVEQARIAGKASALHPITGPLYDAYAALAHERDHRGALDLNLPEYKIHFDASGNVESILPRARLESHRLIEAYMIAANVAAADYLLQHKAPGIYRVHESPAEEKLEDLRNLLKMSGYSLPKGAIRASNLNRILHASEGKPEQPLVHTSVLRAQMQAYYSHENLGHFGLALEKYCHFTSPIRRYSDLVVHRSLASLIENEKKKPVHQHRLVDLSLHISDTERKAMMAERDASDRYKVSYMARQIGNVFPGNITGLNEYGLFVTLPDTGVTGFVPVRNLGGDFFNYDRKHACFTGSRTRVSYTIGQAMMIRVQEANAITGSLIFEPEGRMERPLREPSKHGRHPSREQSKHRQRNRPKNGPQNKR